MALPKPVSRKELEQMSKWQLLKASIKPYRKIMAYLKPYKLLFATAMVFGILFALSNGAMIFTVHYVARVVFNTEASNVQVVNPMEQMMRKIQGKGDAAEGQEEPEPATNAAGTPGAADAGDPAAAQAPVQVEAKPPPAEKDWVKILQVCMLVPLVMLVRNLCGFFNSYLTLKCGTLMLQDVRNEVFRHIMSLGLDFFDQSKSGELIQIIYARTKMLQNGAVQVASQIVKEPFSIMVALAVLFYLDPWFTLFTMVLFPLCIVPVAIISRSVRKAGADEEKEGGNFTVLLQETFGGIRTIKSFAREKYERKRVTAAGYKMTHNMLRWKRAMTLVGPMVEVVGSFGVTIAIFYAVFTGLDGATFVTLVMVLNLIYPPFKSLSRLHITMQKVIVTTEQIFAILEMKPSVEDAPEAKELTFKKGEIAFHGVRFGFRKDVAAVKNIDVTFEAGKYYALVGESGAGKSTMFALINRFYDPQKGYITFDGQDIRRVTQESLRNHIGMVTQSNFLFHDTIYQNIVYGKLDATEEEVYEAAKRAHAHDFIMEQPDGYDTVVGDAGSRLSGGQKQRICIARTLLEDAPVLLLDEATSALDAESEERIKEVLEELTRDRTTIAIAHRFSSLQKADEIIVMHEGEIVEKGTHEELYAADGHYTRLYNLQFQAEQRGQGALGGDREDIKDLAETAEEMAEDVFEGV